MRTIKMFVITLVKRYRNPYNVSFHMFTVRRLITDRVFRYLE